MHLAENTVDGWSGVIADLAAKRQAEREHAERLSPPRSRFAAKPVSLNCWIWRPSAVLRSTSPTRLIAFLQ